MSGRSARKCVLPPTARRLRHLQTIFARNLVRKGDGERCLLSCYYVLYRGDGERESDMLHRSEISRGTCNPTWKQLPVQDCTAEAGVTQFLVVIYEEGTDSELARCFVDLGRVSYLCPSIATTPASADPTVYFECHDGVFVSSSPQQPHPVQQLRPTEAHGASGGPEQWLCCVNENLSIEPSQATPELTAPQRLRDIQLNVIRVVALANGIESAKQESAQLRRTIAACLERQRKRRELEIERGLHLRQIQELGAKVRAAAGRIPARREALAQRREQLRSSCEELEAARAVMPEKRARHEALEKHRAALQEQAFDAQRALSCRRQELVAGLSQIYPIEADKVTRSLTVCNMQLPSSSVAAMPNDEAAWTALGHVTHCVELLSKIWGVPLRYTVFPIASRSSIREHAMDRRGDPELLPLCCVRMADKQRYFHAITLLDKNLRRLCKVRKIKGLTGEFSSDRTYLLLHLQYLLQSEPDDYSSDYEIKGVAEDDES
eukprot:TRINITY_DN28787_c0_g1_i1.p1 TRINITY_DN28787_c0_g1~~TRINITY_DN28787_c0_g1_i1.p1  ORF type:complete len:492 (+),score=163.51 TRINITY_DN28787_c0_g1_i1:322-1797(+)